MSAWAYAVDEYDNNGTLHAGEAHPLPYDGDDDLAAQERAEALCDNADEVGVTVRVWRARGAS